MRTEPCRQPGPRWASGRGAPRGQPRQVRAARPAHHPVRGTGRPRQATRTVALLRRYAGDKLVGSGAAITAPRQPTRRHDVVLSASRPRAPRPRPCLARWTSFVARMAEMNHRRANQDPRPVAGRTRHRRASGWRCGVGCGAAQGGLLTPLSRAGTCHHPQTGSGSRNTRSPAASTSAGQRCAAACDAGLVAVFHPQGALGFIHGDTDNSGQAHSQFDGLDSLLPALETFKCADRSAKRSRSRRTVRTTRTEDGLDVLPAATLTASPGQRTSLRMKGYRNRCPVSATRHPNSPTSHATA